MVYGYSKTQWHNKIKKGIYPYATVSFYTPLKPSENLWFSDFFQGV